MNASIAIPATSSTGSTARESALPAYRWVLVFGALCIPIGVMWDISWHSTIGRDTFWTPAHMLTYVGGLVPGLTCGWLAFKTHFFGTPAQREASVRLWGFRAPLGAWVAIWGSFTMLLSAPFDNWWHNAYGLDVKILSPPHTLLAVGMLSVALGVLLLMVSWQNRLSGQQAQSRWPGFLFVFMAGILLLMSSIFLTERSLPNDQHNARFYMASAVTYPLYLVAAARGSSLRWPATITAAVYMVLVLAMTWILPVFEAQPKLAPIYTPVDHMVPPAFPLLLVVPAIGIDLVSRFFRRFNPPASRWRAFFRDAIVALILGVVFTGLFLAVQWNVSKFLISPGAENWVFAGNRFFPYSSGNGPWRHKFWDLQEDPLTLTKVFIVAGCAVLFSRIGLGFGTWLAKVRR